MKVLVAGFYNHHNLGDDAFRVAIPKIIGNDHEYVFCHINSLPSIQEIETSFDVFLLGAGDVVLPYFLDKCSEKKICIPKILFGAGLTYPSSIALGHLDQFDSVFLRNLSDLRDVEKRLTVEQTHYVPDLVFALDGVVPQKYHSMRPRAGFYLIQSIDEQNPDNKDRHKRVLRQVAQCIEFVAETHDVVLIRFDTSGKRDSDDKTVCKKMMDMCKSLVDAGILQYDEKQELRTPEDMMKFMSTCQVNICMRFHAHVFSIIQNIPFVSLSLTRKVRLLMNETGLANDCGVVVKEDQKTLRAVDVPVEEFKQKFKNVVARRHEIADRLKNIHYQRQALLLSGIYEKQIFACKKSARPINGREKESLDSICEILSETWQKLLKFSLEQTPPSSEEECSTLYQSPIRSKHKVENAVTTVCRNVVYLITKQTDSNYMWGFIDNMKKNPFKFREYVSWMMSDHAVCEANRQGQQKFCFDFIKQIEGTKLHRSGWPFVVSNMHILASKTGVLCDLYVDRTFHWGLQMLSCAGVIPYTQSWVGFIHHTPLPDYSDYNTISMLQNPLFLASLQTCRGLFVLSQYMKEWLDGELPKLCLERPVPVCTLTHPTEIPSCEGCFTMENFIGNRNRMLVEVGAWLRDKFAIFDLGLLDNADRALTIASRKMADKKRKKNLCEEKWGPSVGYVLIDGKKRRLRRCVLRGRDMGLYMPPKNLCINECERICDSEPNSSVDDSTESMSRICRVDCRIKCDCGKMCRINATNVAGLSIETIITNKWVEGLRSHVNETVLPSVDILETLDNAAYDRLLSENIVFLCLQKPSACNTIIEAIVRKTPILINKEPAVVEMLGKEYPFYYDSLAEALLKSRDINLIRKTHLYLCNMDQRKFEISYFLQSIKDSEIYKSL